MKLSDFDYHIPKDLIAQSPLPRRDSSKLCLIDRRSNKLEHRLFSDIAEYLRPGDVLVLNDTKVVPSRLYGIKPSGGTTEIVLLKELDTNTWEALVKGLKRGRVTLKEGITAHVSPFNGAAKVVFENGNIKSLLNNIAVMALPPYIKRMAVLSDKERYQTVYAEKEGAIAAPTAGLHFTDNIIDSIRGKGVEVKKLTLHIGCGTFKPVRAADIRSHSMDEELYEIPGTTSDAVNRAKSEGRRIIAVGTTVTRALEASGSDKGNTRVKKGSGSASIFIYPGYRFRIIDALITNFHQPRSTPIMLTSAFSGLDLLKKAYKEGQKANYRFFSYGDAMMIT
jgi:S-adenosylmethionine:tRNA ribosyltransferase-isomerase